MAITKIIVSCTDDTMGDTSPADCESYREWFASQLEAEYPGVDIEVTARQVSNHIEVDDDSDTADLIDELHRFSNLCWDRCPWDFCE